MCCNINKIVRMLANSSPTLQITLYQDKVFQKAFGIPWEHRFHPCNKFSRDITICYQFLVSETKQLLAANPTDRKFDSAWVPARRERGSGGGGFGGRGPSKLMLALHCIIPTGGETLLAHFAAISYHSWSRNSGFPLLR